MKYSKYNSLIPKDDRTILYNIATDGILMLNPEIADIVKTNMEDVSKIKEIHPELYDAMSKLSMVVNDTDNEEQNVTNLWKMEDCDQTSFYLTVYPTIDCNLHCWYCYEQHKAHADMSQEVLERVFKLIVNVVRKPLKNFSLSFFGGEPLMQFKSVVLPLMEFTKDICKQNNVDLHIDMTTNGVLLTDEVRKEILSLNLQSKPVFQITIDGNRTEHNISRSTKDGNDTFDIIIKNIKDTLRAGMYVNNRFNYTKNSVDSFIDVLDEFEDLSEEERKLLFFDFQQVWQEEAYREIREKAMNMASFYNTQSCQVRIEKRFNKERCKNDAENQATINYDGLVYKCTAICFNPGNAEGILNDEGQIEWNERYKKRMALKYGNPVCQKCKVFPICHGGCSQAKLSSGVHGCILGYSQKEKDDIIKGRLDYILRTGKNN